MEIMNKVMLAGEICGKLEYSHEVADKRFYSGHLKTDRTSGVPDYVPFVVSDKVIDVTDDWDGVFVEMEGHFRSYNKWRDGRSRLILSVAVRRFRRLRNVFYSDNHIELDGYICKEPIYRETPLGKKVCDLLVATDRPHGNTDYIPCITWGRQAVLTGSFPVGTHVRLEGRIQSREYVKRISDDEFETRTAYEVSVSKLEVVED